MYIRQKDYKVLWDFSVQTDYVIEARRTDSVVVNKTRRTCEIFDFAVLEDSRIE